MRHSLVLGLTLALFPACRLSEPSVRQLAEATFEDHAGHHGGGGLDMAVAERQAARAERVRELAAAEGELETPQELFYAMAVLEYSPRAADLDLGLELAQRAVELGDDRGFVWLAKFTDLALLRQGLPQRYGTQVVFEPVLGGWRLYATDPATTDAERAAMGLPPLARLRARVDELNQSELTQALRGQRVADPPPLDD